MKGSIGGRKGVQVSICIFRANQLRFTWNFVAPHNHLLTWWNFFFLARYFCAIIGRYLSERIEIFWHVLHNNISLILELCGCKPDMCGSCSNFTHPHPTLHHPRGLPQTCLSITGHRPLGKYNCMAGRLNQRLISVNRCGWFYAVVRSGRLMIFHHKGTGRVIWPKMYMERL